MSFILTRIIQILTGLVIMTSTETGVVWFAGLCMVMYAIASWHDAYRPLRADLY